jgi:hypothetical protein
MGFKLVTLCPERSITVRSLCREAIEVGFKTRDSMEFQFPLHDTVHIWEYSYCSLLLLLLLLLLLGRDWVHLVLRPLLAYCTSPRWQMRVIVKQLVEWRLAEETEVLGENLPQRHSVHHKSHMTRLALEPGRRVWKPATDRLSYGAALYENIPPALLYTRTRVVWLYKPTTIWEQVAAYETQRVFRINSKIIYFIFRIWLFINRDNKVLVDVYLVEASH